MANYKPKACKWCNNIFTPHTPSDKYCGTECAKLSKAQQRSERRAKRREANPNFFPKNCKICGVEFTPTHPNSHHCSEACRKEGALRRSRDYKARNREAILKASRAYRAQHRDECRDRNADWYKRNQEHKKAYSRQWYANNREYAKERKKNFRAKNLGECRAASIAWYYANQARAIENSRKWRARNPETAKASLIKWRANNQDKVGKAKARRAQSELEGSATPELIQQKWDTSSHTCILCEQPIDDTLPARHPKSRTLEHLIPIARGGTHDIDNLDFAHYSCNASKGAKTLEEYREWRKRVA